jgi:hypothetical protein
METRRWTNPSQPQTLQIAVFLLYINAFFLVLFGAIGYFPLLFVAIGGVAAGYGIANEQRWGYGLGVIVAAIPLVLLLTGQTATDVIGLMFDIALAALLLHPQSRDYQRIWFS